MISEFRPHGLNVRQVDLDAISCPHLNKCLETWHRWREDRPAPTWNDVTLYTLPPLVLPFSVVLDVIDDGKDFRYRYWGSGLTTLFGRDDTGRLVSELPVQQSVELRLIQLRTVLDQIAPVAFETDFEKLENLSAPKTNLRMPIMDKPGKVTKILCHSSTASFDSAIVKDLSRFWSEVDQDPAIC